MKTVADSEVQSCPSVAASAADWVVGTARDVASCLPADVAAAWDCSHHMLMACLTQDTPWTVSFVDSTAAEPC